MQILNGIDCRPLVVVCLVIGGLFIPAAPARGQRVTEIAPKSDQSSEAPPAAESTKPSSDVGAQPAAAACGEGWTPNSCSIENEAFVRRFELVGLFAVPCAFALLVPLLLPRIYGPKLAWWATGPALRWATLATLGFLISAVVLVALPWIGIPILLRTGFIAGCRPCVASVSNYAPLGLPWGLPEMGMAILSPLSLIIYLALATSVWSLLYLAVFWAWRKRSGFTAQAYQRS